MNNDRKMTGVMRSSIFLTAVILLSGCTTGFDPDELTPGMRSEAVINKVGEPKAILPLVDDYEIWRYQDDNVLLMENGRIQNVGTMTTEQYQRTLEEVERATARTKSAPIR